MKPRTKPTRPGVALQRQAILEAAAAEFTAGGSSAVSVAAICRAAGLSRDTFYRCYDNKEQVIDALYERAVSAPMLASITSPEAAYGDRQWLQESIEQVVDSIAAESQIAQFLFVESADPSTRAHAVIGRAFRRVAGDMQRWCRAEYGGTPSRECFLGLLSATQWLVHEALSEGGSPARLKQAKRAILELFLVLFQGARAWAQEQKG